MNRLKVTTSTADAMTVGPPFTDSGNSATIRTVQEGRVATATVLVCDLVGSTAQRTSLGDDAADELAMVLEQMLRHAVARYHGSVSKSTGDGLQAIFDAASDALNAAVDMHQSTELRNRGVPPSQQLVLRIGVSAGDIRFLANDWHGTPMVEAVRLESAAEPGSIFVSNLARLMAGSRGGHVYEPVGELELKGLEPITAFRVPWTPLADDSRTSPEPRDVPTSGPIPLPGRLALTPRGGVVGYTRELTLIKEALARTASHEGLEVLLISGEAGQGKTTLAGEAARAAFDDGACVLFGHCEEDLATPYQLFAEALGHYVLHAPEAPLLDHVERFGSGLPRLTSALAARVPSLPAAPTTDAETERFLVFAAVVGLLADASEDQPMVLVLDDMHWADRASLLLLRHLCATAVKARVLILGVFRDSELSSAPALLETLAELRRHAPVGRLELRGLDESGVVELMERLAGHPLGDSETELGHAVYHETDGNPFFVNQVLRHLVETGAIYQDSAGRWSADDAVVARVPLPESVHEVVGGRVVRLGDQTERLLKIASVIGRDFDLDLLARAAGSPDDVVVDALDGAATAALVRETGTPGHYQFAHTLIQHTLYEDLGPTRRAYVHRQVAVALEDLCAGTPGDRVGELARHWTNASGTETASKAIRYSREAGDAALSALAPSDALRHYANALALYASDATEDPLLTIDLAIGLGTAQRQVGDPAFRATLLDAARRSVLVDDTQRLVAAALATHRGLFSNFGAIDAERIAIFEQALARVSIAEPARTLILAMYCLEIVVGMPLERRQELADEALAIASSTGDAAVTVRVLNDLAYALMAPPTLDESLARTAEGLARAQDLGDPVLLFFAANWRRQACAQAGRVSEMGACTDLMRELVARLNQPVLTWVHTFGLAWLEIVSGETDSAERFAGEALQIGTDSGQPDAEFIYGGQLMMIHYQRGTLNVLSDLMEDMAAGTPSLAGVLSGALAIADMEVDDAEGARRRLAAFAEDGFELEMNPIWITGMVFHTDAVIELGDPAFAGPLHERLAPWVDQWSDNGATAANPICHYLGGLASVLGRYDDANAHFAQSEAMCEEAGAQFFLAQTHLLWGRMLLNRGETSQRERALVLLRNAHESCSPQRVRKRADSSGTCARGALAAALRSCSWWLAVPSRSPRPASPSAAGCTDA